MSTKLLQQLANGDRQGKIKLTFARPTEITVRSNFRGPVRVRQETVTVLEGHVPGGWGDAFQVIRDDGPDGRESWDVPVLTGPTVTSFDEDD